MKSRDISDDEKLATVFRVLLEGCDMIRDMVRNSVAESKRGNHATALEVLLRANAGLGHYHQMFGPAIALFSERAKGRSGGHKMN